MDGVPAWVRERADQIDAAMSNVEVGSERLDRVIGIGGVVESSEIVVEPMALEVRQTGAVLHWRTQTGEDRIFGSPQVTITDDVGTTYTVFPLGWSGGGQGSKGETVLTPRPPDAARTMVIDV
jgi:hypothetical protein